MAYEQPKSRSCASLAGQLFHPLPGTPLDNAPWTNTAVPAGSRGPIIAVGTKLVERDRPGVPVRFIGNNTANNLLNSPLDKAKVDAAIAKYRARGTNLIRLHHIEAYLMMHGPLYGNAINTPGSRNYNADRLDELDYFLYKCKEAGIYYTFGLASSNLAMNVNSTDRYSSTNNTSGTVTITVTGGAITSVVPLAAGTNYTMPPTCIISDVAGQNGVGAVVKANINAAGTITGYTVVDGGRNYSNSVTLAHFGGNGKAHMRMLIDENIRNEWFLTVQDILTHVNKYTGVRMMDDPALLLVECMNESQMIRNTVDVVEPQLFPAWRKWLADRYSDSIATLNTRWGTSFTSFWDVALAPKTYNYSPSTNADRWHYAESLYWMDQAEEEYYRYFTTKIRSIGYSRLLVTRDIANDPRISKVFNKVDTQVQALHAYPALLDNLAPGGVYKTASGTRNSPSCASNSSSALWNSLVALKPDTPRIFGEAGFPMPGRYRGEFGIVFAAAASTHDFSGIVVHADSVISTTFGGAADNRSGYRGLWPHRYERDPLMIASTFLMNRMFHRRDIDTLPVTKTYTVNDKALSTYANFNDIAAGQPPFYSYKLVGVGLELGLFHAITRTETVWDYSDSEAVAAAWRTDIAKPMYSAGSPSTSLVIEHGFDPTHETYDWLVNKGYNTNTADQPYSAVRYTKNRQVFFDRVAGLCGINTPRSQVMQAFKPYIQPSATVVKQGFGHTSNAARTTPVIPGNGYNTNFMGNRFWNDMVVDYIEDGTLLGVTSQSLDPISTAEKLVIVACSNVYNQGATFTANGNKLTGFTITAGGTGYPAAVDISITGTGGARAQAVGYTTGGVITSYRITDPGSGFTVAPTSFTVTSPAGTGSGATFGSATITPDDESKEIVVGVPSTGDEGWPFSMQRFVVEFTLTSVDTSVPWVLYELDYAGNRIGMLPTKKTARGLSVRIDSSKTVAPSVFFELVKGSRYYKPNPALP